MSYKKDTEKGRPLRHVATPKKPNGLFHKDSKNGRPDKWETVKRVFFAPIPKEKESENAEFECNYWKNEAERAAYLKAEYDKLDNHKIRRYLARSGILSGERVDLGRLGAALRAMYAVNSSHNMSAEFYGVFMYESSVKALIKHCDRWGDKCRT